MHDKRVKKDETKVVVDCARFLTSKKTGKNKTIHGMATHVKQCKTMRNKEVKVIGELAKAKANKNIIVGMVRR